MKLKAKYFDIDDIEVRVNWINNPKIHKTMYFELPATVEKTLNWFKNNIGNQKRVDFTFQEERGNIVAMGGFTAIDNTHSNAEFYIMINPELQGKGLGTLISKWLFNYAFLKFNLNKIYLYTNDGNEKAYNLYENCGFKLEGVMRKHKYKNEEFQNRRFYGLLRNEWEQLDWKSTQIDYKI